MYPAAPPRSTRSQRPRSGGSLWDSRAGEDAPPRLPQCVDELRIRLRVPSGRRLRGHGQRLVERFCGASLLIPTTPRAGRGWPAYGTWPRRITAGTARDR